MFCCLYSLVYNKQTEYGQQIDKNALAVYQFVTFKTFPDFPGWFYCLGLRSKAGRFQAKLFAQLMFCTLTFSHQNLSQF